MINFILYSIMPFLFILGFCITIHEFGHFLLAKIFGIPVEKFSIGYGPPLIRMKIGETDFRIAYFPLGGYVKMAGEDEGKILKQDKEPSPEPETPKLPEGQLGFYDAPIYKRIIVVLAGPLFNLVSAFIVLFFSFVIYGLIITPYMRVQIVEGSYYENSGLVTGDSIIALDGIPVSYWEEFLERGNHRKEITVTALRDGEVVDITLLFEAESTGLRPIIPPLIANLKQNGPADKAGMKKGDLVLRIDDQQIHTWYEMVEIVRQTKDTPLVFKWQHGDEERLAEITPTTIYDPIAKDTIGQIGVFMPHSRKYLSIINAMGLAIERTVELTYRMLDIFYKLITRQIPANQIGGPIAIFKLSAESAHWGFEHLLGLLTIISINLGIINLFPIPALDGGHILIGTIEAIRRKRFSKKTLLIMQQIGYALILLLILFVTFNDITR